VFKLADRRFFELAVLLYGLSTIYTIFLWRQGFRRDNRVNYLLLAGGFVLHTWAMLLRGFSYNRCPTSNLYEATIFIAWTMVAVYLGLGVWRRLRFLGAFASPVLFCIGVFALMPWLDVQGQRSVHVSGFLRSLHIALILLACGAFGVSAVAGLMFLTQEHDLKFNKRRAVSSLMPSIQRLEYVAEAMLVPAFVLLTVGMISGSFWLKESRGVYFQHDPIIIWTYGIWMFYLTLLVLRWKFAQRGRRFARGTVGGFVFVMLTFWGFYLLSPVHHH
jgi:ABC-type transport system involved in cytochrome c biogenesis permease subunit